MSGEAEVRVGPHWSRDGGFRWRWLARLTSGRLGLGRWTQAEFDSIQVRAREEHERHRHLWEGEG